MPVNPNSHAIPRLTILGGGPYAARLIELLCNEIELPRLELVLCGRRLTPVKNIVNYANHHFSKLRPDWKFNATNSLAEALENAQLVVLLVRIGGLAARSHDETFPQQFGLVGDEGLSVGGFANAWRTLPWLSKLVRLLEENAPNAKLLNLMAPLGLTTRFLTMQKRDVIGVCELPAVTLELLLNLCPKLSQQSLCYAGLNHLGWFWLADTPVQTLQRIVQPAIDNQVVDSITLQTMQAIPLHYYYRVFSPRAGERIGVTANPQRANNLTKLNLHLNSQLSAPPKQEIDFSVRPTPWFECALIPIIKALFRGESYSGFINISNQGTIAELPADTIVEVKAELHADHLQIKSPKQLPAPVSHFLCTIAEAEELMLAAVTSCDSNFLKQALQRLPLEIKQEQLQTLINEVIRPFQKHT